MAHFRDFRELSFVVLVSKKKRKIHGGSAFYIVIIRNLHRLTDRLTINAQSSNISLVVLEEEKNLT